MTQWGTAAVAVLGTLLLCNDGSPPNVGDAWALVVMLAARTAGLQSGFSGRLQSGFTATGIH